jgi:Fe-S-cluster containining protein
MAKETLSNDSFGCDVNLILSKIHDALSSGFIYTHTRVNKNTSKNLEVASFMYALIELLSEKGLISIEEIDERKKTVAGRLVERFVRSGIGMMYQDPEFNKYTFDKEAQVDCLNCIPHCKAICCKLPFALSRQDVEEGVIRWDLGRPYLICHGLDGYCVHLNRRTYLCSVHDKRPVPCRGFDCRNDKNWDVWLDYGKKFLNPELEAKISNSNEKAYKSVYYKKN